MFQGRKRTINAKAENLNMTGSIKDRMALHIMAQGYAKGLHMATMNGHPAR